MFSALAPRDGSGCRFAVVHLRGDVFAFPCRQDTGVEIHDIPCSLADLICVENDVVMMIIEHEGDVEFLA